MSGENNSELKIKDTKCAFDKKFFSSTIRLSVTLCEPDEDTSSVFDYISLITEEKRTRRREKEKCTVNNGSLDDNGNADEIKKLAQHFEEKYGGTPKKKKKRKAPTFYNYSELATGYDESDSFIDNSEAFDEALPDEMETFHGGYYVNCGELEFKKIEIGDENSDLEEMRVMKKKNSVLKSDNSDSEAESAKSDVDKSESIEEESESINKLPDENNHKETEPGKNENGPNVVKTTEKLKLEKPRETTTSYVNAKLNGEIKKRNKYKKRRLSEEKETDLSKHKKKTITVKSLLEEKRVVENGDKSSDIIRNSVNDVIESVVNAAARHGSEDSRDSISSSSDTKSIDSRTSYETEKESHLEEMEITESTDATISVSNVSKEESMLPDNLPSDVLDLINQIKDTFQSSDSGVRTFFDSNINKKLLSLELKVIPLMPIVRHYAYDHLASFLPCSKDTLMKRAKKLLIEQEEKHMIEPFKKLKASIDKIMPSLMDSYTVSCQQIADEKSINDYVQNGDADDKKIHSNKMPQKKFLWTDETRNYLRELVACRLNCFHMLKPRKELPDEYVKKFLDTKVKSLWLAGWMDTATLWKEANSNNVSSKNKKSSATNNSNVVNTKKSHTSSVPSSTNNLSASTTINAANYNNFLTNLQSLYPITSSTSIPYHTDLNLINAATLLPPQTSNLSISMDVISRLAMANNQQYPSGHAYSKSTSPPKKQTPASAYTSQRSTTPVSIAAQQVVNSYDHKKSDKLSNDTASSSYNNNTFKVDSLINTAKTKKEHHMLNHVSQYNKHYSHKTEKRKANNADKKDSNSNVNGKHQLSSHSISKSTSHNGTTNAVVAQNKTGCDQVLDLSPNKIKNDAKTKPSEQQPFNSAKDVSASIAAASSVTAKDHNYWSSSGRKKEESSEVKEEKRRDTPPLMQRTSSASADTSNANQNTAPKLTHFSRKQRILQESAKSTQELVKSTSFDATKAVSPATQALLNLQESTYPVKSESQLKNVTSAAKIKNEYEKVPSVEENTPTLLHEEKQLIQETATAADILSKMNEDNSTPLQTQFTNSNFENNRIKTEVKLEDVDMEQSTKIEIKSVISQKDTSQTDKTTTSSFNSERKTSNSDRADLEAEDVIKDLQVLNQIGGHSVQRRIDYQDPRYVHRHDMDFNNGSMLAQSSPHSFESIKSCSIPTMHISGFQDVFSKFATPPDAFFGSKLQQRHENNRSPLVNHITSSTSVKQGNTPLHSFQQSVIRPPTSLQLHTPESKS